MSQTPITVTYSLEKILGQINQKLDKIDDRFECIEEDLTELKIGQTRLEGKIEKLEIELKGEIKTLSTEVQGISKRLDTQEFINRSVVVGFVLGITTGIIKLLFPNFPNR